jgi:hypothetical protein
MGFIMEPLLQAVYPDGNQRGTLSDFEIELRLGSCARTMP